jgi:hypothetical protein
MAWGLLVFLLPVVGSANAADVLVTWSLKLGAEVARVPRSRLRDALGLPHCTRLGGVGIFINFYEVYAL